MVERRLTVAIFESPDSRDGTHDSAQAADVLHAMQGQVLGEASIYATYSLNPMVEG